MDQKSPDAFRTISEVAEWLGVPTHVLRFWESRFTQVKPVKRAGGRRYYRPSDMELLGGIRKLLHDDGLTIRGVQKLLREEGVKHVAAMSPPLDLGADDAGDGNVVSLTARSRSTEADEAEPVADEVQAEPEPEETAPPAVDAAMDEDAVEPVDPEEDRPVAFTTEDEGGYVEDDTPAPVEDPETHQDAPDPFAEEAAPAADPLDEATPLDDITSGDLPDDEDEAGPEPDAAETLVRDIVTSGALPGDEDEETPFAAWTAHEASEAEEHIPDAALEVTAEDDSEIASEPVGHPDPTHPEPHLTRADPEPDHPDSPPETAEPETPEPETPVEEGSDWADEFASAPVDTPAEEGSDEPMAAQDAPPILVMPDIPDDPMDGTLPPHIAPVAPRLRRLRAHQVMLRGATLRALSDRLQTLRSDPERPHPD